MLDFCLDDGERLLLLKENQASNNATQTQSKTVALDNKFNPTVFDSPDTMTGIQKDWQADLLNKSEGIKQKVTLQWLKALEITPIILALAHNYWQWLYLTRKNYYDFSSFFLSLDFIIWLFLLITGAAFGIISLKYSERKSFAITALVVLAINVILSIVPK